MYMGVDIFDDLRDLVRCDMHVELSAFRTIEEGGDKFWV